MTGGFGTLDKFAKIITPTTADTGTLIRILNE